MATQSKAHTLVWSWTKPGSFSTLRQSRDSCVSPDLEEFTLISRHFPVLLQNSHYNSWRESYEKPRQCIKKQRHHFVNRDPYSQSYGFSSSHVRIGELGHKEGLVPKYWCFWIVVLDKTLQSSLDSKENKSILKAINPEYSLEGLMLNLKLQYFWHLMRTADSLQKTLMLGKIEGKRRRGQQRMKWLASPTQ